MCCFLTQLIDVPKYQITKLNLITKKKYIRRCGLAYMIVSARLLSTKASFQKDSGGEMAGQNLKCFQCCFGAYLDDKQTTSQFLRDY